MGSSTGEADERPESHVYLDAFLMDQNHTTVEQYAKFLDTTSHDAPPEWNIMSRVRHQKRRSSMGSGRIVRAIRN